jgi:hypothetical protein
MERVGPIRADPRPVAKTRIAGTPRFFPEAQGDRRGDMLNLEI